mmetsp:Transcript_60482/g.139499  ORF Transcript_60482/g.139499 Transcript_60482/m.139499 type:complete len:211 (-) Transcript_60482:946-1578(-)
MNTAAWAPLLTCSRSMKPGRHAPERSSRIDEGAGNRPRYHGGVRHSNGECRAQLRIPMGIPATCALAAIAALLELVTIFGLGLEMGLPLLCLPVLRCVAQPGRRHRHGRSNTTRTTRLRAGPRGGGATFRRRRWRRRLRRRQPLRRGRERRCWRPAPSISRRGILPPCGRSSRGSHGVCIQRGPDHVLWVAGEVLRRPLPIQKKRRNFAP